MMSISVDTSAVEQRFDRAKTRIHEFGSTDMPAEMIAWQRDDMHRQYPTTETDSASGHSPTSHTGGTQSVQTHIWPRSRLSKPRRHGTTRPLGRPKGVKTGQGKKLVKTAKPLVRGAHRPILRPELMTRLHERMAALMQSKITWV